MDKDILRALDTVYLNLQELERYAKNALSKIMPVSLKHVMPIKDKIKLVDLFELIGQSLRYAEKIERF
jgi:hypothetical protein